MRISRKKSRTFFAIFVSRPTERSVCIRVCKHGCGVKMFRFSRADHASTNSKLDKFTLFTHSFVGCNLENRYKEFDPHGALMINRGNCILFVFHLYCCSKHKLSTILIANAANLARFVT